MRAAGREAQTRPDHLRAAGGPGSGPVAATAGSLFHPKTHFSGTSTQSTPATPGASDTPAEPVRGRAPEPSYRQDHGPGPAAHPAVRALNAGSARRCAVIRSPIRASPSGGDSPPESDRWAWRATGPPTHRHAYRPDRRGLAADPAALHPARRSARPGVHRPHNQGAALSPRMRADHALVRRITGLALGASTREAPRQRQTRNTHLHEPPGGRPRTKLSGCGAAPVPGARPADVLVG